MPKDFFKKIVARIKKLRPQKSIVSNDDIKLIKDVHGRRFPGIRQIIHTSKLLSGIERLIFQVSILVFLISFVWLFISISSNYRVQGPAVGGKYIEAIVGSPELINPVFASLNEVDMDISRLVYSGLMRIDNKQRLVPDLAVKYEISEDNKEYLFYLREDVVWHDNMPFTAEDVVFTIQTIQNESVNSPLLLSFQGVKVEAIDDYTVKFTLNEPFALFLSSLTLGILPEHVWFDIAPDRMRLTQKNLQPIGTGPFEYKRFIKNDAGYIQRFELERFENYYRQVPYIKEFVLEFFSDYEGDTGAIQALRQQSVDGIHFVPSDLRDKVERKYINIHTLQLPQYTALFFNKTRQTKLEDKDVRLALSYALDKDQIVRESLHGEGQVIYSPILPGFPGYDPEIEKTTHSIEKANELLDKTWERFSASEYRAERKQKLIEDWLATNSEPEAVIDPSLILPLEVDDNSDSPVVESETETVDEERQISADVDIQIEEQLNSEINEAQTFYRKNKDGEIFELSLVTVDRHEYPHAAERIVGFWQELGIKTNLEFVEPKDLSKQVLKDRSYDILLYGVILGNDPDQYPFWHSSQIDFPYLNLAGYVNRDADKLLEEAREAADEEAVIEAYKKFQDLILEDLPAIFLYTPTYTYATHEDIKGVGVTRIFTPSDRFADVFSWYIKTKGKWNF
ncbi:hypothetical protein KJ641_01930 [Patescibacteria group bacterium]|nr:hypothetical protein [Patescibacteria group bacterium]MBU1895608.1 hypothetical protein [Patescibacteria group bacterium]